MPILGIFPTGTGGGGNIHVLDIGAAEFDPTAMDFSQYAAGDVILVVSDAVVEEAVQGGAGGT